MCEWISNRRMNTQLISNHFIDTGEEFIYHNGMWEDDLRNRNVLNEI